MTTTDLRFDSSFRGAGAAREPGIHNPCGWIPDSRASRGFRNDKRAVVPIARSGIVASEFCRRAARAEVAAVFARSFYLRSGDTFVCIGDAAIGNGPLTLIAEAQLRPAQLGLQPGQPAVVSERRIGIGALAFALDRCEQWHAPAWPRPRSSSVLTHALDSIARLAATEAPPEGLGRVISDVSEREASFVRIARTRIARFAAWLWDATAADGAPAVSFPVPVRDLIGLGPGLTPSGDDFLIGALALLDALGEARAHAALACALGHVPPGLTSPLSRCFLRTAAAGHVGENLHDAIAALISGHAEAAAAAIKRIGHSSGWDMMAGTVCALRVVMTQMKPPPGPASAIRGTHGSMPYRATRAC